MKVYQNNIAKEQRPSKAIQSDGGLEMESNDGSMKILLKRTIIFTGNMEGESFNTALFIKEDDGWTKTNNSTPYNSIEDFVRALGESEDFTQAVKDYEYIKRMTK